MAGSRALFIFAVPRAEYSTGISASGRFRWARKPWTRTGPALPRARTGIARCRPASSPTGEQRRAGRAGSASRSCCFRLGVLINVEHQLALGHLFQARGGGQWDGFPPLVDGAGGDAQRPRYGGLGAEMLDDVLSFHAGMFSILDFLSKAGNSR